jgi:hypothetical protein
MKTVARIFILVWTLFAAGQTGAETWSQQLSPKKPHNDFKIIAARHKDADEGDVYYFSVTVKLKDNAFGLPIHSRVLQIYNGKEFISSCEVQPKGVDGERVYSFRVAQKYLEKSTFTYTDSAAVLNSIGFWFYLNDFAEAK